MEGASKNDEADVRRQLEVRGESAASHAKAALASSERSSTIAPRAVRRACESSGDIGEI